MWRASIRSKISEWIQCDRTVARWIVCVSLHAWSLELLNICIKFFFSRALAQICPYPRMLNLITIAAPHQGITAYPTCSNHLGAFSFLCSSLEKLSDSLSDGWIGQHSITLISFWHSRNNNVYKNSNSFLNRINNENAYNSNYVNNLQNLQRFVMVKQVNDKTLVPSETALFGFHDENLMKDSPMEKTYTYYANRLGLKEMSENGKLIRLFAPGEHCEIKISWFSTNIIPFLREHY